MLKRLLWCVLVLAACSPSVNPSQPTPAGGTPTAETAVWIEPAGAVTVENVTQIRSLGRLDAPGTASTLFAYAFSPDGTRLAALNNTQLLGWDLVTGKLAFNTARLDATEVFYAPDKTEIYTLDGAGVVQIYDAQSGRQQNNFRGHTAYDSVEAYDDDEGWLAIAGTNGEVKVWDTAERRSLVTLLAHQRRVSALAFSPDGTHLATAGEEGVVRVWNWREQTEITSLDHQGAVAQRMVFSPDGRQLAVGTNTYIAIWSVAPEAPNFGQLDFALQTDEGGASEVLKYSPDGKYLINGGLIPDLHIWDPKTGQRVAALPGIGGDRTSAAFSPDGTLLLASVLDGAVTLWDMTRITGQTVQRANLDIGSQRILYVDWTSDGFLMAFFDATGPVYFWGIGK